MGNNEAIVLQVGDRFFHSYKNKRIQTAWCIWGANFFHSPEDGRLDFIENILKKKGYKSERKIIELRLKP